MRTLLVHGGDPNGVPLSGLSVSASCLLRFRDYTSLIAGPREQVPRRISTPQTVLITAAEIEARRKRKCHFWSSADCVTLNHHRGGDGATALEEACKHESIEILELILSSSPDNSFWKTSDSQTDIPEPATPSSLSVSNPLICAIKTRQNNHLRRVLNLDMNPNSMPLACRQQSYSPTMATLMCCDPPNWNALSLLLPHTKIEYNLVTPLKKVQSLQITVALFSTPLLKRILETGFSISATPPTALGHALLHIACLPLDITHVNIFQERIYSSAHEFGQLSPERMKYHILFDIDGPQPQPTDFFPTQAELVHYLLSQSPHPNALLAAQDCHRNTALHSSAMYRTVDQELLDSLLDSSEKAQDVYYDFRNHWGWTAENLVRHGEVAEVVALSFNFLFSSKYLRIR